jgi:hypothetical protein
MPRAKEALGPLYEQWLKTRDFTLKDGTKCRVEGYYGAERNAEGELTCDLDLRLSDGMQLEFTVKRTG